MNNLSLIYKINVKNKGKIFHRNKNNNFNLFINFFSSEEEAYHRNQNEASDDEVPEENNGKICIFLFI